MNWHVLVTHGITGVVLCGERHHRATQLWETLCRELCTINISSRCETSYFHLGFLLFFFLTELKPSARSSGPSLSGLDSLHISQKIAVLGFIKVHAGHAHVAPESSTATSGGEVGTIGGTTGGAGGAYVGAPDHGNRGAG